jgi:hypothetical protein
MGGGGLLKGPKYNGSPSLLISTAFPEHEWLPWKFDQVPKRFWDDSKNQRKFLDWVAKELNVKDHNDWYKVTHKDIVSLGGSGLLTKHENSHFAMLPKVYPEYEWLPWRFGVCPKNYWDDTKNQKKFLDWVAKELNITDYSGWFKITRDVISILTFFLKLKEIIKMGGTMLHQNNLRNVLSAVFEGPTDLKSTSPSHKKAQFALKSMLQIMFPNQGEQIPYKRLICE